MEHRGAADARGRCGAKGRRRKIARITWRTPLRTRRKRFLKVSSTDEAEPETLLTYSAVEVLRTKDFAALSEAELHSVTALIRTIEWRPDRRRTRRKRPRRTARIWTSPALRYGLRYGGETIELAWQRPKLKRRPLVVLCDISGSMALYSRILLQFLYVLTNGLGHVEAFVFGTR